MTGPPYPQLLSNRSPFRFFFARSFALCASLAASTDCSPMPGPRNIDLSFKRLPGPPGPQRLSHRSTFFDSCVTVFALLACLAAIAPIAKSIISTWRALSFVSFSNFRIDFGPRRRQPSGCLVVVVVGHYSYRSPCARKTHSLHSLLLSNLLWSLA